jgi:HlyD family secretion protein
MDRQIKKKIITPQRVLIGAGVVAFLVFAVNTLLNGSQSTVNVNRERVTISKVEQGTFNDYIVMTGVVQPLKTYELDAIEGGYVAKKFLDGGASVKQGDPILQLENQRLMLDFVNRETEMYELINNLENTRLQLRQNKFALRKILSELDYQIERAKQEHDRNDKLYADRVVSQQVWETSKNTYERLLQQRAIEIENQQFQEENSLTQIKQLEGTLERTRLNLLMMKQNLSNLTVKAPVSGLLSRVDVEIGSSITTGQKIGQIDDTNGFKMRVEVDEHYVARIFTGLEGTFEFNGETIGLVINKVYPEVNNGRFAVDMVFKTVPDGIRRGQSVPVKIQLGKPAQVLLLPTGGFYNSTGGGWVYALAPDGTKAYKRTVTFGRKNPQFYEVLEGLQPGEQVITSSYDAMGDHDVVVF